MEGGRDIEVKVDRGRTRDNGHPSGTRSQGTSPEPGDLPSDGADPNSHLLGDARLDLGGPLLGDANLVYVFDGTLEGLLSAIFQIYAHSDHDRVSDIQPAGSPAACQTSLFASLEQVDTDLEHAERVHAGICKRFGQVVFQRIAWVSRSAEPDMGMTIYRYIRLGFAKGPKVLDDMTNEVVAAFDAHLLTVSNERHKMLQFARFASTEQGVYYARINPKAAVVPLIMGHFAERFNVQSFLIFDETHGEVGVYDHRERRWWLADAADFETPDCSGDCFGALWQTFYDAICIDERRNTRAQHKEMIYRYWRNLPEVQLKA